MTLQASSASASILKAIAMICLSTFLPAAPETVAAYLAAHAGTSKASTLGRRVAAIGYAHKLAGLETPTDTEGVKATMRGIRRTFGSARVRKAPAVAAKMLGMSRRTLLHRLDAYGVARPRKGGA